MTTSFLNDAGRDIFRLAFEISPIILTGGIAGAIPGGLLPIIAITEATNLVAGLLSGISIGFDQFFAHFRPAIGSTLYDTAFAHYPFANVATAANAQIAQPLHISLIMECPVNRAGGNTSKLITFTALKAVLETHRQKGGTYTVATPTCLYQNLLLSSLKNIGDTANQVQTQWQWDFEQPLITLQDAQQAQNDQMSKISAGVPSTGATSGLAGTLGSTGSGAGQAVLGTAGSTGASVGSFQSAVPIPVTSTPLPAP